MEFMRITLIAFAFVVFAPAILIGQSAAKPRGVQTVELLSPFVYDAKDKAIWDQTRYPNSCLNLVTLKFGCGSGVTVDYGTRIGVNRDLFKISGGAVGRTRMVAVGKFAWTDKFTVPYVEPWAPLAPGERRQVSMNASGANGVAGEPGGSGASGIGGMNGDGTFTPARPSVTSTVPRTTGKSFATAPVTEQVSSKVIGKDGKERIDPYTPLTHLKKDHMYAVRVVDESHDYYILVRVDEVVTGDRIRISFLKLDVTEAR